LFWQARACRQIIDLVEKIFVHLSGDSRIARKNLRLTFVLHKLNNSLQAAACRATIGRPYGIKGCFV
jgi:hypothetical protein